MTRQQTADLLAERRGQHGNGALHKVHACRALPSIAVKGSVGLDKVRDIGNVHANIVSAVVVRLDGEGIIEILRIFGVDRKDTLAAEILTSIELALGNAV